ncbi:MAG: hypothetical protein LBM23_09625 [Propionibacteriaceae bacterium]|jgi:hypothetical protein|nr:hypothetical protein [Propionibacteriaceae bacterium]
MSALASEDVLVRAAPERRRPRLIAVADAPGRHLANGPFALLVLGLLAIGMVGHLLLQTTIMEQSLALEELEGRSTALYQQEALLNAELEQRSAAPSLAAEAGRLGMVANPYATYVVIPSGEIRGVNHPVTGTEMPVMSGVVPAAGAGQ